jgi:hypothetical protein
MVPKMIPGGNPVIDEPGLNATSPLSTEEPVFVMVDDATAAKDTSEPSDGAVAANEGTKADATMMESQPMPRGTKFK